MLANICYSAHSVACIFAVIITIVVIMCNKKVTGSKKMAYQSEGVHGLYPEDPCQDDPTLILTQV